MKYLLLTVVSVLTVALAPAQRYRVLITEIMADPSPSVGLPAYEWVELFNAGPEAVSLAGWRLADGSGQSGPMPNFELGAGAFVVLGSASAAAAMQTFANCIAVSSWPSLDNAGDGIVMYDNNGLPVHEVFYDLSWYRNSIKAAGGWTLEMIRTDLPCVGQQNWIASEQVLGGSPGTGPGFTHNPLFDPIRMLGASSIANDRLHLRFNHAPDSQWLSQISNFQIAEGPPIRYCETDGLPFTEAILHLESELEENRVYRIIASNMRDCGPGGPFSDTLLTGLASMPEAGDILINEILFNPPPDGNDFIELLNNSERIVNLSQLQIASRNSAGQLQSWQLLSNNNEFFFPGQYLAFCTDSSWLRSRFPTAPADRLRTLGSMPGLPDREGTAVLLRTDGVMLDELNYSESWHFQLLTDLENVSLERVSAELPTQDAGSWHSASASSGYGTPGYQNSQHILLSRASGTFRLSSSQFSPDNDGFEDRLLIFYDMETAGMLAGIRVFNAGGQTVRMILANGLLGRSGQFAWDGLDDFGRMLPTGIYIIWVEWFDLNGRRGLWKRGVVKK